MRYATWFAWLFLSAAACGGAEPEDDAIQLGRYQYTSFFDAGPLADGGEYGGVLRVTSLAPMIGDWEVPGFDPAFSGPAGSSGRDYLIGAKVNMGTRWLILHRIRRQGSDYSCEGTATIGTSAGLISHDVTCSIIYLGL